MRRYHWIPLAALVALTLFLGGTALAGNAFLGDNVPRMAVQDLLEKLDSPDIMIIDVRRNSDYDGSELMIQNAHRRAYNDVAAWAGALPKDKTLVLYCA